jgi:methyl-accepting chemotaxis protein
MKIGIIGTKEQVKDLLATLNGYSRVEVRWAAGNGLDGMPLPVYSRPEDALVGARVDIILDATGRAQGLDAPLMPPAAALALLAAGSTQEARERGDVLVSASNQLNNNITQIVAQIQQMGDNSRRLSEAGSQLDGVAKGILSALERTSDILGSITRIAKRSKIIGLNSAIEAARVGESGQGFMVVAEEIKTLADDSARSVREIERILQGIQRQSHEFSSRINTVQDISVLHQHATQEINSLLEVLSTLGKNLSNLADGIQQ